MGPCWAPGLSGFEMGGASPLCEGPAGEDDKDVCKWQWFSPLILWSLFSFNIFVDN